MGDGTFWRGSPSQVRFRRVRADTVEVTRKRWWGLARPHVKRLVCARASWFWAESGIELRLAPEWVWNSLAFALEREDPNAG